MKHSKKRNKQTKIELSVIKNTLKEIKQNRNLGK